MATPTKQKLKNFNFELSPINKNKNFSLIQDLNSSILSQSPHLNKSFNFDTFNNNNNNIHLNDNDNDNDNDDNDGDTHLNRFRLWRHDAMMQHLYDSAAFWGDKVLHLTNDPNDAFWLAQTYFLSHNYLTSLNLLIRPFYLTDHDTPIRLFQVSLFCRYLTAQCQVRLGKWSEALEMLGDDNPFRNNDNHGPSVKSTDGGIKIESSLCHLRGLIHLHLNSTERAKACFLEAISLDVKNYDSFLKLIGGSMLNEDEEWDLVQNLSYKEQTETDSNFIKLMYVTQLKKNSRRVDIDNARNELEGFENNVDILQSKADSLYNQYKYKSCYDITSKILINHPSHPSTLTLHIACLQHLKKLKSSLFMLAHTLVQSDPNNSLSWYAVGVYYFLGGKYQDSRRYFSKSSLMDPRFQPAWIGFAHSFALEGEHDQAIIAYSTCSRLFQGNHLPLMYIGMQHIQIANITIAKEFIDGSLAICNTDPLVYHERAVVGYYQSHYDYAVKMFERTLQIVDSSINDDGNEDNFNDIWYATYLGLGQCYRRINEPLKAKECLIKAIDLNSNCVSALTTLGIIYHTLDDLENSIETYHRSLSISPGDSMTTELLKLAVEANVTQTSADRFKRLPLDFNTFANNSTYNNSSVLNGKSNDDNSKVSKRKSINKSGFSEDMTISMVDDEDDVDVDEESMIMDA